MERLNETETGYPRFCFCLLDAGPCFNSGPIESVVLLDERVVLQYGLLR
jgi:hypothetical protein